MFENFESDEDVPEVGLTPRSRLCAGMIALVNIGIIWAFFLWGDRPGATGMTFRSMLHGCIMLSVPFIALLIATLLKADWIAGLLCASLASLAPVCFPFLAFCSWFVTYHAGPMLFLAPTGMILFVPAVKAFRGLSGKAGFVIWSCVLSLLLGYFFWISTQVYLGQKSLYVPCPPDVPCGLRY